MCWVAAAIAADLWGEPSWLVCCGNLVVITQTLLKRQLNMIPLESLGTVI